MRLIHIDDGDALNIDCVVVNQADSKDCKCFYSCDLIDQYEARLKADLVAMLTELQLEIDKMKSYESSDGQDLVMLADIGILFQQKINELKENTDGSN